MGKMPTNSLGKSSELKLHCFAYLMPTACLKICAVPRLIARNTKNPMQGNHWVPLGCRALPGSVKADETLPKVARYKTTTLHRRFEGLGWVKNVDTPTKIVSRYIHSFSILTGCLTYE